MKGSNRYRYSWWMAVLFWLFGIGVLTWASDPVQAAQLNTRYNNLRIDGQYLTMHEYFPYTVTTAGGGTCTIYEDSIYFNNYSGKEVYIYAKPGAKVNLYFSGICRISSGGKALQIVDSSEVSLNINVSSGVTQPSLTITSGGCGIYVENTAAKTTLEIKSNGSYKTNSLNISSQHDGIDVRGKAEGTDYMSLVEIKNILVDIKAKYPLHGRGRRYKNSSLQEGIALSQKAALICTATDHTCIDHAPRITDAPKSSYCELGKSDGDAYALTPWIHSATMNITIPSHMSDGKLVPGTTFPTFLSEGFDKFVYDGITELKRNGVPISGKTQIYKGGTYEATFRLKAVDGYDFAPDMAAGDIKMPTGFTVTGIKRTTMPNTDSKFGSTVPVLLVTVKASSPPLVIKAVYFSGLTLPVSGNSSANLSIKYAAPDASVVSCAWRGPGGTPVSGNFTGGVPYILHVVMAPSENYTFGTKTDGLKTIYVNNEISSTTQITWYTNGRVAIDAQFYADCKVTFDLQGKGSMDPQYVKYNTRLTKPADPGADGYRFMGWLASANPTDVFNFNKVITKDVTVYALWYSLISKVDLATDVKYIAAEETPEASPDLKKSDTGKYEIKSVKWSDSKLGTTFSGDFRDGETYYLYAHLDGSGAFFSQNVVVTVNGDKISSELLSLVSDGRTMYIQIPYTAHIRPLGKKSRAATCEKAGVKEHYECSGCGQWFADENGTKVITDKDSLSVPPAGHKFGAWKDYDDAKHVRTCKKDAAHKEFAEHVFTTKEDTEKRTTTYTCSVCGHTHTTAWAEEPPVEVPDDTPIPPEDAPPADKEDTIIQEDLKDKELDIGRFSLLQLRYKKITDTSITLAWNKVKGAKAYYVYGSPCGQNYVKLKKVKAGKPLQYTQKKLKKGKYYKYLVTAVTSHKKKAVVIAASRTVHLATTGGKVGNYKNVKLKNITGGKLSLKKKKTFKIQAVAVPASKKLTVKQHRKICYESSNTKIAAVSGKGTIKAKKKGKCVIYVYAQSGKFGKINLTVK